MVLTSCATTGSGCGEKKGRPRGEMSDRVGRWTAYHYRARALPCSIFRYPTFENSRSIGDLLGEGFIVPDNLVILIRRANFCSETFSASH